MNATNWELVKRGLTYPEYILAGIAEVSDPHARRLLSAVAKDLKCSFPGDIAGLLRTVIRSRSVTLGVSAELDLPVAAWIPSEADMQAHGIQRRRSGSRLLLRCKPWRPSWLEGVPDDRAYRNRVNGYSLDNIETDPGVRDITNFTTYQSAGQATAVRAACTLPPGETLLINLPTGAGKSLAFEVLFFDAAARNESSLLIVPTTTLALDQERRLKALRIQSVAAYHGGLSDSRKEQIRNDYRNGDLAVLIASPEAVLSSLAHSIRCVTELGGLTTIAIDEAHMVSGWGTDFRPEFQLLGGFIRQLTALAPSRDRRPRTLLMSATVTSQTREDLRSVFGTFAEVAAVSIRTEPEYWAANCETQHQKFDRVLEAVRYLPRPMIVYTSLREEAQSLFESIRAGCLISRIALIRGGDIGITDSDDPVLASWADGRLDIVVATSAFGLGIDNSHVRTVIHACLPETADRFYQEVGRAGRDGRNSVSLLLPVLHGSDLLVARRLSRKRLIREEKGWLRWHAMRVARKVPAPDEPLRWYVDLERPRAGITRPGEANRLWNLRTLALMQASGMIRIASDDRSVAESVDRDWERWIAVEICKPEVVANESAWRREFSQTRSKRLQAGKADLGALLTLTDSQATYGDVFSRIYTPPVGNVASSRGYDPVTRRAGNADDSIPPVCPSTICWPDSAVPEILVRLPIRLFSYKEDINQRRLEKLIIGLVAKGIYDLELPRWLLNATLIREIRLRHPFPIVRPLGKTPCRTTGVQLRGELPTHSLLVADKGFSPVELERCVRRRQRYLPNQIILISEHTTAPASMHQPLAQYLNALSVDVLEQAIFQ